MRPSVGVVFARAGSPLATRIVSVDLNLALKFLAALREAGVRYVLVGGLAMIAHGLVRATRDVDIFLEATSENVALLRQALRSVVNDPSIDEITAEDLIGEYPTIRYISPDGSLVVDIMARLGEAFDFADLSWKDAELQFTTVSLATAETLLGMKQGTLREVDRLDAAWLRSLLDKGEAR